MSNYINTKDKVLFFMQKILWWVSILALVVNKLFKIHIPDIENNLIYGSSDWEPILDG